MRILVTGAAGFIGSHLCHRLAADGHDVIGLDDLSSGSTDNLLHLPVRLVQADVCDPRSVLAAADGCAAILHHAARTSVPRSIAEPERYLDVNVRGTYNVLTAARETRAKVVFASSSSVYGDQTTFPLREELEARPRSPYAATKLAGEALMRAWCHSYGLRAIGFRYFNVYGPRQDPTSEYAAVIPRFVTACLRGGDAVIYGDGEQSRDFTYIDDVVEANVLALAAADDVSGQVLNIGGGREPTSVNRLFELVSTYLGSDTRPLREPARSGDVRRSHADVSRAREVIGYEPRVDVEEGLRRTVESYASSRPQA